LTAKIRILEIYDSKNSYEQLTAEDAGPMEGATSQGHCSPLLAHPNPTANKNVTPGWSRNGSTGMGAGKPDSIYIYNSSCCIILSLKCTPSVLIFLFKVELINDKKIRTERVIILIYI
jgi:hypothetical protein